MTPVFCPQTLMFSHREFCVIGKRSKNRKPRNFLQLGGVYNANTRVFLHDIQCFLFYSIDPSIPRELCRWVSLEIQAKYLEGVNWKCFSGLPRASVGKCVNFIWCLWCLSLGRRGSGPCGSQLPRGSTEPSLVEGWCAKVAHHHFCSPKQGVKPSQIPEMGK